MLLRGNKLLEPVVIHSIHLGQTNRQMPDGNCLSTFVRGINMADESGWQSHETQPQDVEAQAFAHKFNISPDLATRLISTMSRNCSRFPTIALATVNAFVEGYRLGANVERLILASTVTEGLATNSTTQLLAAPTIIRCTD
jgi:hypothetical protein